MNENQYKDVKDLVRQLQLSKGNPADNNWGNAIFLIGAGCSYSAGIPLAAQIAQTCVLKLVNKYSGRRIEVDDPKE